MSESANKKKGKKNKIIFLFLLLFIFIGMRVYYKNSLESVSSENPVDIDIDIPMGSSTARIAGILKREGLIKDKNVFRYVVKNLGLDGKLKAGEYTLNTGMDVSQIIENLSMGGENKNIVKFTIPEGFELKQIGSRLAEMNLVDEKKFMALTKNARKYGDKYPFLKAVPKEQSLEGYLFPATYTVKIDSTEEEIIEKMLDKFEEVYEDDIKDNLTNNELSLNEMVTLASIVEREAKVDEERDIISAVFYNRIKKGMLLESCATVQYALGERKEKLTYNDLKINSIYNTYTHKGLPPGPIASPGLKSLQAAMHPADVDYLFFVSNGDGTHTFSTNYKDHINAQKKK
ncbi:endolytic transglycosylase MltG [Sporanaerobacter acetigenes]|uniref:Endolytic murein transglycosylase n=1 Tax=Sporanaerobacter acetigenes DSM 13106 TaxID=1123281 RepID=A0A1M5UBW3_9FIRM|nr:endolytic transglycosylase MltG [Sporanaerobacter acetigenes]SHH60504.1 UPF0755 protein [Sporanaerobacter acetigenes DSM 13106]